MFFLRCLLLIALLDLTLGDLERLSTSLAKGHVCDTLSVHPLTIIWSFCRVRNAQESDRHEHLGDTIDGAESGLSHVFF